MSTTQGAKRCCALQVALLLLDGVTTPRLGTATTPPPTSSRAVAGVPSDQELEALGAVIGDIYINNENIFDLEEKGDNTALFRLADRLHVKTRAGVVRNYLLFHSGDRFSRRVLDETERILRANKFFYDAWILPVSYHDGVVDVRITTRDVWTLDPGFHYARSGGTNTTGASFSDVNLAGSGTNASIGTTTTVDRSESIVSAAHNNVFGTWITASGSYADASDGVNRSFDLEQPFYALDTHHAYGATGTSYNQQDTIYDLGVIQERFEETARTATAYYGWSPGLQDGWVQRFTIGATYDQHLFGAVPDLLPLPALIPSDRRYDYPWVGYTILEDNYVRTMNHDQIQRTEDFYVGTTASFQVGWTNPQLGSTRNAVLFQSSAGTGFGNVDHNLLLLTETFNGRIESGSLQNALLTAAIHYYMKLDSHWLFYSAFTGNRSWNLDLDQQVLLGGDTGLRGYPLRYQAGTSNGLLTLEQRYFTDWYLFRLFRVGGAIFFDAGRAWGVPPQAAALDLPPSLGLLKDAGFGLRFGNARSGLGNVVHVDLAFPLDAPPTIQKVQFLVDTQATF
jgi:hypothetical protein